MNLPTADMNIAQIITKWPETELVFGAHGLEAFTETAYLERVGRYMKLRTALERKGLGVESFVIQLQILCLRARFISRKMP